MKLKDENLIDTIKKQNTIVGNGQRFYIRVVKKISKRKEKGIQEQKEKTKKEC